MKLYFMTLWDKITAVFAILLGIVFLILGILGLFAGCHFNFFLPPILGVLPFFFGWAMSITLIRYWITSSRFSGRKIFLCPRCQKAAPLRNAGKLQCSACGLRLEIYDDPN